MGDSCPGIQIISETLQRSNAYRITLIDFSVLLRYVESEVKRSLESKDMCNVQRDDDSDYSR